MNPTFEQFCEEIPDGEKPWLDRAAPKTTIENRQRQYHWMSDGYIICPSMIPARLIDAYTARYQADNGENARIGYPSNTPYMTVPEIKDVCLYAPLTDVLKSLIGEEMGMSLNLTNWVSTERNWHQDDYLNPHHVNGHYLAVWIALDDIHPDSGPFEFIPGSHKWPVMRQERVKAYLPEDKRNTPDWPWHAEQFLNDVFEAKIQEYTGKRRFVYLEANEPWVSKGDYYVDDVHPVRQWDTAEKGDVLIWHSWLAHRGSKPKNPDILRKSLICHYSGINHRPDMNEPVLYENGVSKGYYFPF